MPRWTKEDASTAMKMWEAGFRSKDIAMVLGRDHSAVRAYFGQHRDKFPYRNAKRHVVTTKEYLAAKELWAKGRTVREIAEELGLKVSQVSSMTIHHRRDFPYRNDISGTDWVPAAIEMRRSGMTIQAIADRCGVHEHAVRRRFRLAGVA